MNIMNSSMPKWITIYLWVVAVMALVFSVMGYIKPEIQFSTWQAFGQAGALSIIGPLGLYLARNIATVAVCVFALLKPGIAIFQAAFVLRAVTDLLDFALVMFLIEAFALIKIRSLKF
jgi:hypothetical protein